MPECTSQKKREGETVEVKWKKWKKKPVTGLVAEELQRVPDGRGTHVCGEGALAILADGHQIDQRFRGVTLRAHLSLSVLVLRQNHLSNTWSVFAIFHAFNHRTDDGTSQRRSSRAVAQFARVHEPNVGKRARFSKKASLASSARTSGQQRALSCRHHHQCRWIYWGGRWGSRCCQARPVPRAPP